VHPSLEDFETEWTGAPGIHTITAGPDADTTIDLLLDENADSDTLLVFFPSAVSPQDTWPYFQGLSVAKLVGQPLLAFSDPTIALAPRTITGWTMGDHRYWLHRDVPRYIDTVRKGRRLVFVGASAGGFPALHFGSLYPDSVSLVVNPRTNLFAPPTHLQVNPARIYGNVPVSSIPELVPVNAPQPRNTVVYLQNSGDHVYFSGHMVPYLHQLSPEARVWTRLGHWGDGHKVPPREFFHKVVAAVSSAPSVKEAAGSVQLKRFRGIEEVQLRQAELNVARQRAKAARSTGAARSMQETSMQDSAAATGSLTGP
jgi:hypothetical protein